MRYCRRQGSSQHRLLEEDEDPLVWNLALHQLLVIKLRVIPDYPYLYFDAIQIFVIRILSTYGLHKFDLLWKTFVTDPPRHHGWNPET